MDAIERLAALFERFPGIGPRQAQRFVQYILRSSPSLQRELVDAIQGLSGSVRQCLACMRWHAEALPKTAAKTCSICSDRGRDVHLLAVVATDADLVALEKSSTYRGTYFVLGGTLHLGSETTSGLRIKELLASLPGRVEHDLQEIILAFPANPEGDATTQRLHADITQVLPSLKITALGRGLSTGSELEYADPETLRAALASRK